MGNEYNEEENAEEVDFQESEAKAKSLDAIRRHRLLLQSNISESKLRRAAVKAEAEGKADRKTTAKNDEEFEDNENIEEDQPLQLLCPCWSRFRAASRTQQEGQRAAAPSTVDEHVCLEPTLAYPEGLQQVAAKLPPNWHISTYPASNGKHFYCDETGKFESQWDLYVVKTLSRIK